MTFDVPIFKSPNDSLADLVFAKLKEKGFVAEGKDNTIASKLKAGNATVEDWTLWIDLASAKKDKDGDNV